MITKVERVIVLSWIQNLFQMFRKDEEEQSVHDDLHTMKETRSFPQMKNENSKEMNAKIIYQYPKGRFRFPVIPDDENHLNHQDKYVHRNKMQVEEKKAKLDHSGGLKKEKIHSKRDHVSKIHSVRPFRPTEIPSPIYGFHRPEKPVIEHELSHITNGTTDVPESSFSKREIEGAISGFQTTVIDNDKNSFSKENLEKSSSFEEALPINNKTDGSIDSIQIQDPLVENTKTDSLSDITRRSEKDIDSEEILFKTTGKSEVDGTATAMKEQEDSDHTGTESPFTETDYLGDLTIAQTEKSNDAAESFVSKDSDQVHAESEKPKRAHLPFNVMMLKQDKKKWETKQKHLLEENLGGTSEQPSFDKTNKIDPISVERDHTIQNEPNMESYEFPSIQLLKPPVNEDVDSEWLKNQEGLLNQTLQNFNVGAKVVNVTQGPAVTRFEVQPEPGVKVNKVTNLTDDIKLSLAAKDIRIEAPIPGKHTIGIEVPNQKSRPVFISEIINSKTFHESVSPLTAVLGLDISGKPIVTDLKKMPHGLIAGATGSGKSVCINTILVSLLFKARPEDLKLLLIDPKMVELAPYNRIPHLVSPVITDVKAATAALQWAVDEMERRYELFAHAGVRDINRFNELAMEYKRYADKLPFIVIIIDELADLMMMSPADVEEAICRIAQKARACGIHLIIATQRPSVDVITGLIKANVPTRIAFSVSSQVDSRTIIDMIGAEKLLGRGDMLFLENGSSKPLRLQGTFVSDEEIDLVVNHIRNQRDPDYLFQQEELLKKTQISEDEDELFYEACEFIVDQAVASTSSLQRRFKIGYNRAARLMDMMEQEGFISGAKGSKPREVFITEADLESMQVSSPS